MSVTIQGLGPRFRLLLNLMNEGSELVNNLQVGCCVRCARSMYEQRCADALCECMTSIMLVPPHGQEKLETQPDGTADQCCVVLTCCICWLGAGASRQHYVQGSYPTLCGADPGAFTTICFQGKMG